MNQTAQILTVKRVISRVVVQKKHPSFLLSQCKLMRNTITWRCDYTVHLPLLLLLLSWSLLVTSSQPLVSVFSVLSGHVAAISSFLRGSFQWLNTHSVTSDLLFSLTSLSCCWWRIMKLILFTKAPNVWCVWLITRRWKQPDTFKLSPNRTAAVCVAVCSCCSADISDKLITLIITNTHNKHECVFFLHFMLKPNADIKQRSSAL